jgi:NAD(P)-dependent dehydrogenase (short-subunit alcohol dehydrogenase family)
MLRELSRNKAYRVYGTSRHSDTNNFFELDVRSEVSVKDYIKELIRKEGRIDVVVNIVGSSSPLTSFIRNLDRGSLFLRHLATRNSRVGIDSKNPGNLDKGFQGF